MRLSRLSLEHFRNIARLHLDLPPGRTVLFGDNAQGKTNLLEAVYTLAVARSVRAAHERDVIGWDVLGDELPFARVAATVERRTGPLHIEIVVQLGGPVGAAPADARPLLKRVKVNGLPRRAGDLVGEVQAILFEPQDIELVYGPPALRRRHLDITLCQVDRGLLRDLQRYARVLGQRNPLLKAVREGQASPEELGFWDRELVDAGGRIVAARLAALAELDALAREVHADVTAGAEELRLQYRPSFGPEPGADPADVFRAALAALRPREVAQGTTLVGPHRDDVAFLVNGADLAAFGSRGQQRLATLSLKLAERRFMAARTGEEPLLLLDDVLSELDAARRRYLLEAIGSAGQALLTTTDLEAVDPAFRQSAHVLRMATGAVEAVATAR